MAKRTKKRAAKKAAKKRSEASKLGTSRASAIRARFVKLRGELRTVSQRLVKDQEALRRCKKKVRDLHKEAKSATTTSRAKKAAKKATVGARKDPSFETKHYLMGKASVGIEKLTNGMWRWGVIMGSRETGGVAKSYQKALGTAGKIARRWQEPGKKAAKKAAKKTTKKAAKKAAKKTTKKAAKKTTKKAAKKAAKKTTKKAAKKAAKKTTKKAAKKAAKKTTKKAAKKTAKKTAVAVAQGGGGTTRTGAKMAKKAAEKAGKKTVAKKAAKKTSKKRDTTLGIIVGTGKRARSYACIPV
jgi:hypothetical protein